MPRTFAYLRVSTTGQTTDNQLQEIKAAGFNYARLFGVRRKLDSRARRHASLGACAPPSVHALPHEGT